MLTRLRVVFFGALIASTISYANGIDFIGLDKMPGDLRIHVRQTIAYSPELEANPDITAALSEGRVIVEQDYAFIDTDEVKLHLVLCDLKTKTAEVLTTQERDRSNTVSEQPKIDPDIGPGETHSTTTSDNLGETLDDSERKSEGVDFTPNTSYSSPNNLSVANVNAKTTQKDEVREQGSHTEDNRKRGNGSNDQDPPAVPLMGQETHVIGLYFAEHNFDDFPTIYTLLHVGAKVVGPIRRALADLIGKMREKKFKSDLFQETKYLEAKVWTTECRQFIAEKMHKYFSTAGGEPILYTFAGRRDSKLWDQAVVYKFSENKKVHYIAAAHRESTDPHIPSTDLSSGIEHLSARERAEMILNLEWKTVVPPLRVSYNYLKCDSSSSSGALAKSLSNSGSATKVNLNTSQTLLNQFSNLTKWGLKTTQQQILQYAVESGQMTEAEKAKTDLRIIVTLRPTKEPEHMSNWEPVAFLLCQLERADTIEYFVAVMSNIMVKAKLVRMILNFCSTPSAALTTAETFLKQYLFWANQNNSKLSRYAKIFNDSTIENTLREQLVMASQELLNIPGLMDAGKKVSADATTWDCKLVAATDSAHLIEDNFEVFVLEFPNIGQRPLYIAVLRKSVNPVKKKSGGLLSKFTNNNNASSSKLLAENNSAIEDTIGISTFYFNLQDLLNRPSAEFKEIYDKRRKDILVAFDLQNVEWWKSISERIRGEVEEELELLPYPMLSLDSMKVNFKYALYPALLHEEQHFYVQKTDAPKIYAGCTPKYILCEVQCGLGLGYLKHFALVLEDRDKVTLRLVTQYGSTVQGSAEVVVRFVDEYLYWKEPETDIAGKVIQEKIPYNFPDELKVEIATQLWNGVKRRAGVENKMKNRSTPIRVKELLLSSQQSGADGSNTKTADSTPAESTLTDSTLLEYLTKEWSPPMQRAAYQRDKIQVEVLVLKQTSKGLLALIVVNKTKGWARLASFCNSFSSIRNKPAKEFDRETGGGFSEYSIYWSNELRSTPRWEPYFQQYRTSQLEAEMQNILFNIMRRALPPTKMNSTDFGIKGTLQQAVDDFYFMYAVEWLPTTKKEDIVAANDKTDICLVQMKPLGMGDKVLAIHGKPRFFKSEGEAQDYALMYDCLGA